MFTETRAFSGFAVGDVARAKEFYGDTLGLKVTEANGMLTLHLATGADVMVYPKPGHVPATYTILNFPVDSVDDAVDELAARGVTMARYEGFGQDDRGVMRGHGPDIAWFTDPDGNVLSVVGTR
ncbi:VOC family protein [Longispora sp. K20-0274]|uniref:VOC family protein n=1 Tax=Longispora sp. K20-0274 TaxID=3088255 RepID=UPI00399A78BD